MSIEYCFECGEQIDTDYDTEHFCYSCECCLDTNQASEDEPICLDCLKAQQDAINTDNYHATSGRL